jgi:hypothetical protein
MKRTLFLLPVAAASTLLAPASQPSSAQPAITQPATADTVKSIDLPQMPPDLPDHPGRIAVMTSCIICHSPRYITMQPEFPRKTWEAQVEKMRKVYGAPIPDALVPDIVNYLIAVRGKSEPATQSTR